MPKKTPTGALDIPEPASSPLRLIKKHFIEKIPPHGGCKINHPSQMCFVCNSVTPDALTDLGLQITDHRKEFSSYWCPQCKRTYASLNVFDCFILTQTKIFTRIKDSRHEQFIEIIRLVPDPGE